MRGSVWLGAEARAQEIGPFETLRRCQIVAGANLARVLPPLRGHEIHDGSRFAQRLAWVSLLCALTGPFALFFGLRAKREVDAQPGRYGNASDAGFAVGLGGLMTALLLMAALAAALLYRSGFLSHGRSTGRQTSTCSSRRGGSSKPQAQGRPSQPWLRSGYAGAVRIGALAGVYFRMSTMVKPVRLTTFSGLGASDIFLRRG